MISRGIFRSISLISIRNYPLKWKKPQIKSLGRCLSRMRSTLSAEPVVDSQHTRLDKKHVKRTNQCFSSGRVISWIELNNDSGCLQVEFEDGFNTEYPYTWLRDNCTCPKCFNIHSIARTFVMANMDPDIKPTMAKLTPDGSVYIDWPEGHQSTYSAEWLEGRSFTPEAQEHRKLWHAPPCELWGHHDMQDKIPEFEFDQLMEDDHVLYDWICTIHTKGILRLKNAPHQQKQLHRIADRIGHFRITGYGVTSQVESKGNPTNLAYTTGSLAMHTDMPYYQTIPGMQMLHCISNVPSEGGENQFADGFYVANKLKESYPEDFEVLTNTIVDHFNIGDDYYKYFLFGSHPTIALDREGNVNHIYMSNMSRDSYQNMSGKDKARLYRALIRFNKMLYQPENHIEYKLQAGDIMCLHNSRILHGRSSYRILSEGKRHLEAGYIDWDEMDSKRRRLAMTLDIHHHT